MSYISEAKANEFFESNCMYIDGHGDLILSRDAGQLICEDAIKAEEENICGGTDTDHGIYLENGIELYTRKGFMTAVTLHNFRETMKRLDSEDLNEKERQGVANLSLYF